jgi:hypothetical protein
LGPLREAHIKAPRGGVKMSSRSSARGQAAKR